MLKTLRNNISFLLPYSILLIIGAIVVIYYDKIAIHQAMNEYHFVWLDYLMKAITLIGGNIPFIVVGILLFYKFRVCAYVLSTQLLATVIVQPIKYLFHAPRPFIVFNQAGLDLYQVAGVTLHHWNSFPSGHSAAVFAMMLTFTTLTKNKLLQAAFLIIALLTAYSRIYLSQHFLVDTLVGSLIGVISVLTISHYFIDKQWGEKNIITLFHNDNGTKKEQSK